jgi:hypothetical protein
MKFKMLSTEAGAALIAILLLACSVIAEKRTPVDEQTTQSTFVVTDNADPISGDWNVTFFVHNSTTPGTFILKLDGSKVTGTVYSNHTGPGVVRDGKWADGKLSFTLDFKNHESIAITGTVQADKLVGEFHTEGFTDKWEATRRNEFRADNGRAHGF